MKIIFILTTTQNYYINIHIHILTTNEETCTQMHKRLKIATMIINFNIIDIGRKGQRFTNENNFIQFVNIYHYEKLSCVPIFWSYTHFVSR